MAPFMMPPPWSDIILQSSFIPQSYFRFFPWDVTYNSGKRYINGQRAPKNLSFVKPECDIFVNLRMEPLKDVIIEETLEGVGSARFENYLAHALCLGGSCPFKFNGKQFELRESDLMIVRKGKLLDDIRPSGDFKVKVLYVTAPFIELCTPQTNYGMKGQLSLFLNPIMSLDSGQRFVCERDFRWIDYRLN